MLLIIILHILNFSISSILPIYNSEMFSNLPYPLYITFLQIFLAVPFLLLIAWFSNNFHFSWMIPPKSAVLKLLVSSLFYGFMMFTGNFGFYVSSVDFAVLFRLSTPIFSTILGILFLNEKLNTIGIISMIFVFTGILFLSFNFQWSQSKMPSFFQCIIQLIAVLSSALSGFTFKIASKELEKYYMKNAQITIMVWRFLFGSLPVLFSSLYIEPGIWSNLEFVNDTRLFKWVFAGVFITLLFQFINTYLSRKTTLITMSVVIQMKFIPSLIISHIVFHETKWNFQQLIGMVILTLGVLLYSFSRAISKDKDKDKKKSNDATISEKFIAIETDQENSKDEFEISEN